MTARYTRPAFSAKPTYVCPQCGKVTQAGGWQAQHDYDDHLAAHARWAAVRAEAVAAATWPLLLALSLYVALTAWWDGLDSLHRRTWLLAALVSALATAASALSGGRR